MYTSRRSTKSLVAFRAVVVALITLLTVACTQRQEELPLPNNLRPADLLAAPSRFDGRVVKISGFAVIRLEHVALYSSTENAEIGASDDGVWLDLDFRSYAGFDGKAVEVEGRFHSGPSGHFQSFDGEVSPVAKISVMRDSDGNEQN